MPPFGFSGCLRKSLQLKEHGHQIRSQSRRKNQRQGPPGFQCFENKVFSPTAFTREI
jgi:hypothetical protein